MRPLAVLLCLLALPLAAADAGAQSKSKKEVCWVCEEDPKLMAAAGIVNHGPFPFLKTDSAEMQAHLGSRDLQWLETTHFRLGTDLKKWKIPVSEMKAYRAELALLAEKFPNIDPKKTKTIDVPLRLHLMAERMETLFADVTTMFGWTREDFEKLPPEQTFVEASEGEWREFLNADYQDRPTRTAGFPTWIGVGRYLGMPMKYEILMLQYKADMLEVKNHYLGHTNSHPQRWHNTWRTQDATEPVSRSMWFAISAEAEKVKHDQHMHNALLHNVGINILDGYMLYLVEAPVWLRVGLGHFFHRRNNPDYNFYDLDEGAAEMDRDTKKWAPAVRKLVAAGEADSFAQLGRLRSFGDISFEAHLVSWSKFCFLYETRPEEFAAWILKLKTNPNFTNNLDAQREAMRECFGWTFQQAEEKWQAWVLETYPVK
ncbi:MAG: hypothetical protein ACYTF3_12215 [Planctomycetota bacterium]|jgi:hypothetical protein